MKKSVTILSDLSCSPNGKNLTDFFIERSGEIMEKGFHKNILELHNLINIIKENGECCFQVSNPNKLDLLFLDLLKVVSDGLFWRMSNVDDIYTITI
jgi:hypothetical protein